MIFKKIYFLKNKIRDREPLSYSEMSSISPLQEIRKAAQEVQRVLCSLSFPSGEGAIVEPDVIEEAVVKCKPCRLYTHGQEKPEWAIHGCPKKKHRRNELLTPQLPASERPATKQWGSKIRQNGNGYSCIHPECRQYKNIFPNKQATQQHARKHYPPEYKCQDCDGEWYLKTQYNQHFLIPCPHCDKLFMKGSLPGHKKNCKH